MLVGSARWWAWLALFAAVLLSCSKDSSRETTATGGSSTGELIPLFGLCTPGDQCADSECVPTRPDVHTCEKRCESDTDCGFKIPAPVEEVDAVCGTLSAELKVCTLPCDRHEPGSYACQNGRPVSCDALDETSCLVCGCPENMRCEANMGCFPKRGLGEDCLDDQDCISDNCDNYAKLCRVQVGAPCSAANCERCETAEGFSYCSRKCQGDYQCNGGYCDLLSDVHRVCRPPCRAQTDATCPGECELYFHGFSSPDLYFCDCSECDAIDGLRGVGGPCEVASQCGDDGLCLKHAVDTLGLGMCSYRCTQANHCVAGKACVDVPCSEDETESCGTMCLAECDTEPCSAGNCRSLLALDGTPVEVCDAKLPDGAPCTTPANCQSGNCTDSACAPAP